MGALAALVQEKRRAKRSGVYVLVFEACLDQMYVEYLNIDSILPSWFATARWAGIRLCLASLLEQASSSFYGVGS